MKQLERREQKPWMRSASRRCLMGLQRQRGSDKRVRTVWAACGARHGPAVRAVRPRSGGDALTALRGSVASSSTCKRLCGP